MTDEGPSSEDLDRFGGETAPCPDCGAEIWDQAGCCPRCGALIGGGGPLRSRWIIVAALIAAVALVAAVLAW